MDEVSGDGGILGQQSVLDDEELISKVIEEYNAPLSWRHPQRQILWRYRDLLKNQFSEHSVKGLASAGSSAAVNPCDTVGGSAEPSGRPVEPVLRTIADRLSDRADELAHGDIRAPRTAELLYEGAVKLRKLLEALKLMLDEYECNGWKCDDLTKEAIAAAEEKL